MVSLYFAYAWFTILLLAITLYGISLARRSVYNVEENILYIPTFLFGRLLWRVHFTNEAPEELKSGGVLVANHRSSVDPFFVQLSAGRRVHWMVAKEYCNHFAFGPLLKLCQVIPTNRSGMDTASTKAAIRMTREGRLVGMFPEGRLNKTDEALLSFRSGAAVVAEKARVPIIPLWIEGSPYRRTVWSPVTMAANVRITFGTPIPTVQPGNDAPSSESRADELMLKWGKQLVQLSGKPNQEIRLSARRKRKRSS